MTYGMQLMQWHRTEPGFMPNFSARSARLLGGPGQEGMPLLVHGEVTDPEVDIFDREREFIDCVLQPLLARLPGLRVVMEHITTAGASSARPLPAAPLLRVSCRVHYGTRRALAICVPGGILRVTELLL